LNNISVKHSGPSGDIIHSLPAVKKFAEQNGPVTYYLGLNKKAFYYEGAQHPDGDNALTQARAEMLIPLLEAQPYIEKAAIWTGEKVVLDLDAIHYYKTGKPFGVINRWYFHVFVELTNDLSQPTLDIPHPLIPELAGAIIVNCTSRYRNEEISFRFLQHRKERVVFIGTLHELTAFRIDVPKAEYVETPTCLDIARVIASGALFCGSQSMCNAIAEEMKVRRVLSPAFGQFNNVVPCGKDGYDVFTQPNFERIVSMLLD